MSIPITLEIKMTLHEWLQKTWLTSNCCIDIVEVYDNGSCYHRLETTEPALKDEPEFRFAKKYSEITYKELELYLDLDYESSYIYNISQFDLIIVEVKVKGKG